MRVPLTVVALLLAASSLRSDADKAYRAKDYAKACELFARARDEAPRDGAAWADLGLCLGKLGKRTQAIAATRRAIEMGDARTRLNAYFNLAALRAALHVPEAKVDAESSIAPVPACLALPAARGCAKEVFACSRFVSTGGTGVNGMEASLVFGTDEAALEEFARGPGEAAPRFVDLSMMSYEQDKCRLIDICGFPECEEEPAADAEQCKAAFEEECQQKMRGCSSAPVYKKKRCVVVHADACSGRVGVVCAGQARELEYGR
jgi:hypothetical protein